MFDIIVLAVIIILTVIGLYNGMVKQIFGLVGLAAGCLLAIRYYPLCATYVTGVHPGAAKAISFIAIFLACILIAHLIGWIVGRIFSLSGLGFLNRIGGGLLGFLKGYLIVCVAVMVLMVFLPSNKSVFKGSYTIKYILPIASLLRAVTHDDIKTKYDEKTGKEKSPSPKHKPDTTPPF